MDELAKRIHQIYIDKAMANKEHWGVHERHCCPKHGCKYGNPDCPVVLGLTEIHNENCEMCDDEKRDPQPLDIIEAYLVKDIERAKLDYHHCYGACPEDGTETYALENVLKLVKESRVNPQKVAKRGKEEGWWK